MQKKQKIVVGNWKMNPASLSEAKRITASVLRKAKNIYGIKTVICPPFVYLKDLGDLIRRNSNFYLGVQDMFWEDQGSFTGQISPLMLKDLGVEFVIVGHSELRTLGETDLEANRKIVSALKNNISVILCIGENERDKDGKYFSVLKEQIKTGLSKIKKADLKKITIAYEPVWAIGATKAISGGDLYESTLFIRKVVSEIYDKPAAMDISIIYGGSVTFSNAGDIISEGGVSGFLIGRQSLDPASFTEIMKMAEAN